jgi:hypothetical protein
MDYQQALSLNKRLPKKLTSVQQLDETLKYINANGVIKRMNVLRDVLSMNNDYTVNGIFHKLEKDGYIITYLHPTDNIHNQTRRLSPPLAICFLFL